MVGGTASGADSKRADDGEDISEKMDIRAIVRHWPATIRTRSLECNRYGQVHGFETSEFQASEKN